ncbi:MAG: NUDIX domain-containing protein [Proteobacteria bacterium]|nr:NUDIX domain-containing protein [Pseudomonadota bacterium]
MPAQEMFDIFDADMHPTGQVVEKASAHEQGLWHQVFHCWIVRALEDGDAAVLFQMRSRTKSTYAGLLDISAAGHLSAGETPEDGIRELEEELGITAKPDELVSIGIQKINTGTTGYPNREFCHTFILERHEKPEEYILQPEEVDGVFEMRLSDAFGLFSGEEEKVRVRGVARMMGKMVPAEKDVTLKDFVPHFDRYYLKIMIMIELHLAGSRYLAI